MHKQTPTCRCYALACTLMRTIVGLFVIYCFDKVNHKNADNKWQYS